MTGSSTIVLDRDTLIKNSLLNFFRHKDRFQILYDAVHKNTPYSLRILEWFVSKYAEKKYIVYTFKTSNGKSKEFNVFLDYRTQLQSYQKKCFDMFRRQSKFKIVLPPSNGIGSGISMVTTIGQMNFFKWAIENHVLEYVTNHLSEIIQDMNENTPKSISSTSSASSDSHLTQKNKSSSSSSSSKQSQRPSSSSSSKKKQHHHHHSDGSDPKLKLKSPEEKKKKKRQSISSVFATRTCIKRYKNIVLEFD